MELRPSIRYRIRLVFTITVVWVILGFLLETFNAIDYDPELDTYTLQPAFGDNLLAHLLITSIGPFLGGVIGGFLIVFYLRDWLHRYSYGMSILLQTIIYLALIVVIIAFVGFVILITSNPSFALAI